MKRFLALILALIMVVSLVACGGSGDTSKPDASKPSGTTSAPATGGDKPSGGTTTPETPKTPSKTHLNYALTSAIVGLDPQGTGYSKSASLQLYKWIYDPLVDVTNDAEVYGCLAESWTVSPDGLT